MREVKEKHRKVTDLPHHCDCLDHSLGQETDLKDFHFFSHVILHFSLQIVRYLLVKTVKIDIS